MRLLPFLVLISTITFGQKIDSLQNAFEHATHDTTRLKVLDALVENQADDYSAIEKYSTRMRDLSEPHLAGSTVQEKKIYAHYYGTALNNLAYVTENKSDNAGAIVLYEKALSTFQEVGDKPGEAMCLTNLGFVSKKTGDLANAIKYYQQATNINKEVNNQPGSYASINNLGLAYYTLGDIPKALTCYFEALKIAEELGDKRRQARVLNNIAGVYHAQKEMKLHREYLEKGLKMAVEAGEKRGEAALLNNLIATLIEAKEYEQATTHATRSVQMATELNDNALLATSLSSLASIARGKGDFQQAIKYEKEALTMRQNLKSKIDLLGSHNALGEIYMSLKKPAESIPYFKQSVALSQEASYPRGISRAAKNLSEAYKQTGNSAKALEYYDLHIQMRDSITNEENRKATFKQQYKYEYEIKATADSIRAASEKQVLNAQLDQEKSQRYALTAVVILVVTLASFGFYRFRVKQQMKELQLRNRIASDLHDEVGSAISSISLFAGIAKMKSGSDTDEIVSKIENTSRETVNNMSDIVWSIEPANDRFDNVIKKMNYFGDHLLGELGIGFSFNYENGIEKSTFDMAKRKNIYLIYKEAINNAAKYSGAKNVSVLISKEGRQYEMEITDDGRGFDTKSSTMGNGLRNMKRRAEEMGGNLLIDSTEKGTVVTLTV